VNYDDYKDNPDAFRPLFEWLGESFDQKRVGSIMSVRHSYDSAGHLPTKSRMD
jgi:hypothetical protein